MTMKSNAALYVFMEMIKDDPRIGPSHISLFLAILYSCKKQGFRMPISIYSKEIMKQAKMRGTGTYHKCIRDLKDYGYIKYLPSNDPVHRSLIYLKN